MSAVRIFRDAAVFVYQHLDEAISVDQIAAGIGTSTTTLKRVFQAATGTSPARFVRRLKMEAGFRSLRDRERSVLEAALAVGFTDHSAFSRSFKRAFGYPPSAARDKVHIQRELEHIVLAQPDFVELKAMQLQCVTAQGHYFECASRAWTALQSRMDAVGIEAERNHVWVGLALDDPHEGDVSAECVRFVAAVEGVNANLGIEHRTTPGGLHARFRFAGKLANLGLAYHYIYGAWRSSTSFRLGDTPALMLFADCPVSGPDAESVMICVPVYDH